MEPFMPPILQRTPSADIHRRASRVAGVAIDTLPDGMREVSCSGKSRPYTRKC